MIFQKRFKRLRRIEDEESDGEGGEGEGEEREAIANELFEGSDNVSLFYKLNLVVYVLK